MVGAIQGVDGVHLDAAHVGDETAKAPGCQRAGAGHGEVLALEEQRTDRMRRDGPVWHALTTATSATRTAVDWLD